MKQLSADFIIGNLWDDDRDTGSPEPNEPGAALVARESTWTTAGQSKRPAIEQDEASHRLAVATEDGRQASPDAVLVDISNQSIEGIRRVSIMGIDLGQF